MIRIASCDDDPAVLRDLSVLIARYQLEKNREIEHDAYRSPLELLSALERGRRYDVLFLDVLMPGENGIETAREIRAMDQAVKIVFLTSSDEFAVQSYTVGAFFYQLKPVREDSVFHLLDGVLDECGRQGRDSLILKCKGGIARVELEKLEYCEAMGRSILLHLHGGRVLETIGRLGDLGEKLLPLGSFLRPHRSYLVNMDYIRNITRRSICMDCMAEIPIPGGKYAELKDAFLAYACEKRQVVI